MEERGSLAYVRIFNELIITCIVQCLLVYVSVFVVSSRSVRTDSVQRLFQV